MSVLLHFLLFLKKASNKLYETLYAKEGEKHLYRLARQRAWAGKDVQQGDGNVLMSETESVEKMEGVLWGAHE